MNISCWPNSDNFLYYGVNSFFNQEKHLARPNLTVVNLTGRNVVDFIKSGIVFPRGNHEVIIIYDTNQQSLAMYCAKTFTNVLAAFPKSNCIQKIKDFTQDEKVISERPACASLTDREFESLLLYVHGYTASKHAKKVNVSVKTIYTHRSHLTMKMGLRKISDLFISV